MLRFLINITKKIKPWGFRELSISNAKEKERNLE
tara:strand:- start:386 stop:487 length:102 start_codon:yes stop_codon:yes gene_type:complete